MKLNYLTDKELAHALDHLSEPELVRINCAVVRRIKELRTQESERKSRVLRISDIVYFRDNYGVIVTGVVTKINRVKAKVKVDNTIWNVPMNLLTVV